MEVKWSDRPGNDPKQLRNLVAFAKEHGIPGNPPDDCASMVTTKTLHQWKTVDGVTIEFVPTSLYAYVLGKNLLQRLGNGKPA